MRECQIFIWEWLKAQTTAFCYNNGDKAWVYMLEKNVKLKRGSLASLWNFETILSKKNWTSCPLLKSRAHSSRWGNSFTKIFLIYHFHLLSKAILRRLFRSSETFSFLFNFWRRLLAGWGKKNKKLKLTTGITQIWRNVWTVK